MFVLRVVGTRATERSLDGILWNCIHLSGGDDEGLLYTNDDSRRFLQEGHRVELVIQEMLRRKLYIGLLRSQDDRIKRLRSSQTYIVVFCILNCSVHLYLFVTSY